MGLRESLWRDTLARVQLRTALCVASDMSVREAIERMRAAATGCSLICDGGKLSGIFTERDWVRRVLACGFDQEQAVRKVMTPQPATVKLTDSVGWTLRTMCQGHYRHLPVLGDAGQILGVVSTKSIVQYLVEYVPSAVYNLPPERRAQQTREGA
jgi:signal-transduction protein with cAMP-binding, CBS, and nucleotidyltransferase domain